AWRVSAVGCRRGGGFIGPFLYRVRASRLRPVHRSASEAGSLNPCRKGFKKHRRGWSASSRNLLEFWPCGGSRRPGTRISILWTAVVGRSGVNGHSTLLAWAFHREEKDSRESSGREESCIRKGDFSTTAGDLTMLDVGRALETGWNAAGQRVTRHALS